MSNDIYTSKIGGQVNISDEKGEPVFIIFDGLSDSEKVVIRKMIDESPVGWTYGKQFVLQSEFVKKDQSKAG